MAVPQGKAVVVVEHLIDHKSSGTPMVSVIVPVLNEEADIEQFALNLTAILPDNNEIVFVDGGSNDKTRPFLESLRQKIPNINIVDSKKGRSIQMNAGAQEAKGETLLFLHADTLLPAKAFLYLREFNSSQFHWGRFDVKLNRPEIAFLIIAWFINHRSRLSKISTGDQAIFVKRQTFTQLGGYREQLIMEDIELSSRLKKIGRPLCIADPVETSARKWQREGVIRTILLMWRLRAAYALGAKPEHLVDKYYKKL
jgi:rSAM/selenodomain-associated transferase 2